MYIVMSIEEMQVQDQKYTLTWRRTMSATEYYLQDYKFIRVYYSILLVKAHNKKCIQ